MSSATGVRRRGSELEASILAAAWAELAAVGYARLTMEGVAARAKTGKQVLYRRWSSRAELVIAAMRAFNGSIADDIPDTGELRSDVLALLRRMVQRQRDVGSDTIHGLLADAPDLDPGFFVVMSDVMTVILERAGVVVSELSPRVVTLPIDLVRHELLRTRGGVGEGALEEIVDEVFLPLVRGKGR